MTAEGRVAVVDRAMRDAIGSAGIDKQITREARAFLCGVDAEGLKFWCAAAGLNPTAVAEASRAMNWTRVRDILPKLQRLALEAA